MTCIIYIFLITLDPYNKVGTLIFYWNTNYHNIKTVHIVLREELNLKCAFLQFYQKFNFSKDIL